MVREPRGDPSLANLCQPPHSPLATRNINLTDALDRFVAELVASGQFQNASEVVRAGLPALKAAEEIRAAKLAGLRAANQEWLAEGEIVDDIDAWFGRLD